MKDRNVPVLTLFVMIFFVAIIVYGCGRGVIEDEIVVPPGGPLITELGPFSVTVDTGPTYSQLCTIEISWITDVPSTTKVIYYLATSETGAALSTESLSLTISHIATITAFSDDFCYRAVSRNAASKESVSGLDSPVMYVVLSATTNEFGRDSFMDQSIPNIPSDSFSPTQLLVGDSGAGEYRTLIYFSLSSVPLDRHIADSATILYCSFENVGVPQMMDIYAEADPVPWQELMATWLDPVNGPGGWVFPLNPPPYVVPPAACGGGSVNPPAPPLPIPLYSWMVGGGGNVPGYWYFPSVHSIFSVPTCNGLVLAYNPVFLGGGANFKTFLSREDADPAKRPALKLYLVKD